LGAETDAEDRYVARQRLTDRGYLDREMGMTLLLVHARSLRI
jgi:hypothetical protein